MILTAATYTLRPVTFADKDFVIESLLDLPLRSMSVAQCENEFSNMEYISRGFDESGITGSNAMCMVLERGSDKISFRYTKFESSHAEIALLARHPTYRGGGHQDADSFLHGYWYFERMACASCYFWGVDTPDVQGAARKWREGTAAAEEQWPSKWGDHKTMKKVTILPAEYFAIKASTPAFANTPVTYID